MNNLGSEAPSRMSGLVNVSCRLAKLLNGRATEQLSCRLAELLTGQAADCTRIKMDSQNMSYKAGQAKGEAQEKTNTMMDKASNAAQSAQESLQEVGNQMQAKAQEAAEAVKNATGMNNNK
ncbi:uncharacterized protein HKW66_Vig0150340 [Vigna angularis]|uniref:Uncharacterized protein n=1 Tax=Phaseolus angularis TaxID=3914 RepID=A0A8T0JY40_PHAAN|nr:uncharacterized protein HKW66_Vig0150340 [Vigna angularis]